MANRIETAGKYLLSVAKRAIGIDAWRYAMRQPTWGVISDDGRPKWAISINEALDHGAPVYAGIEFCFSLTSRLMEDMLRPGYKGLLMLLTGPVDAAINTFIVTPCLWGKLNVGEGLALKLAANATVQAGIDLASVAINRLRHNRPSTTTLAV